MPRISKSAEEYRQNKIPLSGVQYYRSFVPQLATKIYQSLIDSVTLRFNASSLEVNFSWGDRPLVYEEGEFIARTFRRAGIKELTLLPGISRREIEKILTSAQEGQIEPLLELDKNTCIKTSPVEESDAVPGLIPGKYKHYTDQVGYNGIIDGREISAVPHPKNGMIEPKIYITSFSLTPEEVHQLLFMGSPKYADRGRYVISFDLAPELAEQIKGEGVEMSTGQTLCLDDPRVIIRYRGPNYLQEAA